jgi:hypothetical protein
VLVEQRRRVLPSLSFRPKGSAAYNLKLSQQRADSVIKWLSSHGIAAER